MSPKLKTGLIIGGSVLGVLVVLLLGLTLIGPVVGGSFSATVAGLEPAVEYPGYVDDELDAYGRGGGIVVEEAEVEMVEKAMEPQEGLLPASQPAIDTGAQQPLERLIIRTGSISMVVENTREAKEAIEQMVDALANEGAFIVSVNEYGGSDESSPYINMSIRIPSTHFDEVMDRLADMAVEGTNPNRSESAQDVSEEYYDLKARLESMEKARQRLQQLMDNARTTEELLMAEQQLTQREAEIEALKGRKRYLEQSAQLSRVDIDLQPYILSQPVDTRWRPAETVREAFEVLVNSLRDFGDFAIFSSIACLPWVLVAGLVIYGIVRFILWRVRVGREKRATMSAEG